MPGLVAACLAGAALLLPAERLSPASALAAESPRLDVGNRFPAVELTSLAGVRGRIAPDSPLPNAAVLVFFAPQCAKCFKEMAYLEEVYEAARDRGVEVLAVEASGQSAERTRVIMEQYRKFYPLPGYWVLQDPDFKVSRLFSDLKYRPPGRLRTWHRHHGLRKNRVSSSRDLGGFPPRHPSPGTSCNKPLPDRWPSRRRR